MHRRNLAKGNIRPKISTMPRQRSEAAAFLDIYKLVIEKKRLQEELENIDARREQILQRLVVLDQQVSDLEGNVQKMRAADETPDNVPNRPAPSQSTSEPFNTLFLEY
jgi:chromosome segregation ATPase